MAHSRHVVQKYVSSKNRYRTTIFFFFFFFFFAYFYFPASGQAVVTGVIPSPPRFLPSFFIAHRVQQSHCSSIFHRTLLTHALALSASQFVHKKKSQRIYTSMHSAGLQLTKLTYTRLEDNLIRHRGDRLYHIHCRAATIITGIIMAFIFCFCVVFWTRGAQGRMANITTINTF